MHLKRQQLNHALHERAQVLLRHGGVRHAGHFTMRRVGHRAGTWHFHLLHVAHLRMRGRVNFRPTNHTSIALAARRLNHRLSRGSRGPFSWRQRAIARLTFDGQGHHADGYRDDSDDEPDSCAH